MAQNDSMAANTAMIQEVLKRMGIQGRITLDSAKTAYREDRAGSFEKKQAFRNCDMQPGRKSGCGSCDGWIFSCKL